MVNGPTQPADPGECQEASIGNAAPEANNSSKPNFWNKSTRWVAEGLNDWIDLLGLSPDIFGDPPNFTWVRLVRLIGVVLGFCGAMVGTKLIAFGGSMSEIVFQKWPTFILLSGALLTVFYLAIALAIGLKISSRDAFFTIQFLTLPWISLSVGLYILIQTVPDYLLPFMGLVLLVWIWLVPILLTRNLCRAVRIIAPKERVLKVRCAAIVTMALLTLGLLLAVVFAPRPAKNRPANSVGLTHPEATNSSPSVDPLARNKTRPSNRKQMSFRRIEAC